MRRPVFKKASLEFCRSYDRMLASIGPEHPIWGERSVMTVKVEPGAIVWIKPPPGVEPKRVFDLLRDMGAHVKVLPADRVDDVVTEQRTREAKPELSVSDAREVVYQLVRELAGPAGVPWEEGIRVVDSAMDGAGL